MARLFNDAAADRLENDTAAVVAAPFTFGGWFRTDDLTISETILFVGDKDVNNRFYLLEVAGTVAGDPVSLVRLAAGGLDQLRTTAGVAANTWHHACAVVTAANDVDVYLDGGNSANSVLARPPADWDRTSIGRNGRNPVGAYFSGDLAELFFYDVALTTDEVLSLASKVPPSRVRPGNLINYWPVAGVGSPEPDYRGTIDMTVTGTVVADHPPTAPAFGLDLGFVTETPAVAAGAIMNQMQFANLGADLYNGTLIG